MRHFAWASKLVAVAFAVVAIGVVASLLVALAASSAAGATGTCAGKEVYPGANLVAIAKECGPGSTFYVNDGDYSVDQPIPLESGDVLNGEYSDTTRPQIRTQTAQQVINVGNADRVVIRDVAVSGAVGTSACRPDCGRGIHGGFNLTLENVRVYNNVNQGVGGQHPGLIIRNSELDHNGSPEFYLDATYASAAGVKSVQSFQVWNSYIHDNAWQGVWCDLECNAFEVHDSRIVRNGKSGIFYEVSSGPAIVEGNIIKNNGAVAAPMNRQPAGLSVNSSRNLDAYGNTFSDNVNYGFWAIDDVREYTPLENINFHGNRLNGDALKNCDLPGVRCKNNN